MNAFMSWAFSSDGFGSDSGLPIRLHSLGYCEFKLGSSNPKAILIFTAFLPQFVDPSQSVTPQFALLGALLLALEWVAIASYAYMGLHMRRWFSQPRGKRIFNRCCAGLLAAAGSRHPLFPIR